MAGGNSVGTARRFPSGFFLKARPADRIFCGTVLAPWPTIHVYGRPCRRRTTSTSGRPGSGLRMPLTLACNPCGVPQVPPFNPRSRAQTLDPFREWISALLASTSTRKRPIHRRNHGRAVNVETLRVFSDRCCCTPSRSDAPDSGCCAWADEIQRWPAGYRRPAGRSRRNGVGEWAFFRRPAEGWGVGGFRGSSHLPRAPAVWPASSHRQPGGQARQKSLVVSRNHPTVKEGHYLAGNDICYDYCFMSRGPCLSRLFGSWG